ncbi:helix-turn-helix transcriptional regulator [Kiloniella majae]|uniref:helix-turn-helix transcriptional regulator n=1 Tax=Kiloniella majae TaxID=1938558 RepID=UPI000A27808D|nr:helix-turn-helix transcriptional regulator [Kiloniella majae]
MSGEIVQSTNFRPDHDHTNFNTALWVSSLIDNIGKKHFFPWVAEQLKHVIPHEFCMIFQYQKEQCPQVLYDGLSPLGYREGLKNFLQSTWQINPFYHACREGLKPGLHTMEALSRKISSRSYAEKSKSPDDYKMRPDQMEEIGYVTDGWPLGMQELMLAIPLPDNDVIEISLSQKNIPTDKDAPLLERSQELVPIIISAIKKHCEALGLTQEAAQRALIPDRYDLTPREENIMDLILSGHGSEAIGLRLGIALPTVKTHRRNLYRKLGISSQAELFALISRH